MGIPIPLRQLQVDPDYLATVSNAGPLQRDNRNWKENAATMTTRVPYNRVCTVKTGVLPQHPTNTKQMWGVTTAPIGVLWLPP